MERICCMKGFSWGNRAWSMVSSYTGIFNIVV
jgi:hypothetical protein